MSRAIEVVVKIAGAVIGGGFVLLLMAATARGCFGESKRWKEERMGTKVKRLTVSLGQPVEIEYQVTPESRDFAAGVEVSRVFAYSGAVRVEVTPMLRSNVPSLIEELTDRCRKAENLGPEIPF